MDVCYSLGMTGTDIKKALKNLPSPLEQAVDRLAQHAQKSSGRALLVGGMVRDLLTDVPVTDADVEVYGIDATRLRALLEELFPDRVHDVGSSFSVYKVTLDDRHELDVSLPRRESKTGKGHKGFVVEGDPTMSVEDAARRRDFTINAIMADPLTGEIIDPHHGLKDLEHHVLRVVDPKTFIEDPLRVYRALQFTARLELKIDEETKTLLTTMVDRGDLDELPKERVTEELRKLLLKAERPSLGFEFARELGIIQRDYPELQALIGVEQEKEWHPEGDVWVHTMLVVDAAAKIIRRPEWPEPYRFIGALCTMLGALCHDLGKPATTKEIDGRIRSLEHESGGIEPTRSLLARWKFGADAEHAAIMIATEHLKPGMLEKEIEKGRLTEEQYINAVRRLLKRIHPLHWAAFLAACEADWRGRTLPETTFDKPYPPGDHFTKVVRENNLETIHSQSLLRGEDLIALGVPPGPEIGQLIKETEDARDKGKIRTKEEALRLAKQLRTS
jgi:tRNA nucleotidyltransferase (CCA-adding enzyme)